MSRDQELLPTVSNEMDMKLPAGDNEGISEQSQPDLDKWHKGAQVTVSGCSGTITGYDKDTNRFKIKLTNNMMNPEGFFGIEQLKLVEVIKPAETAPPDLNVPPPPSFSGYTPLLEQGHSMTSFNAPFHDSYGFDMSSSYGYGLHPPGYHLESAASFQQQFESSSALQAPAPSNYAAPSASFEQHDPFSPPPMANEKADLGLASLDVFGANGPVVKELAFGENPNPDFVDPYIGSEDTAGLKTMGETEHEEHGGKDDVPLSQGEDIPPEGEKMPLRAGMVESARQKTSRVVKDYMYSGENLKSSIDKMHAANMGQLAFKIHSLASICVDMPLINCTDAACLQWAGPFFQLYEKHGLNQINQLGIHNVEPPCDFSYNDLDDVNQILVARNALKIMHEIKLSFLTGKHKGVRFNAAAAPKLASLLGYNDTISRRNVGKSNESTSINEGKNPFFKAIKRSGNSGDMEDQILVFKDRRIVDFYHRSLVPGEEGASATLKVTINARAVKEFLKLPLDFEITPEEERKKDAYLRQIDSLTENSQLKAEVFRINEKFPSELSLTSGIMDQNKQQQRATIKKWVNNNLFSFLCLDDDFFSKTGNFKAVRNHLFPTLPRTAAILYRNDSKNQTRIKEEHPSANNDKRKGILRVEYNTKLDDATKAPWEEAAKIDKERFEGEVAEFSGSEWLLQACSDEKTTTTTKKNKKKKKKKDPNASLGAISDGDTADTKVAGKGGFNGHEETFRKAAALAAKYHTKSAKSSTADGDTADTKVAGKKKRKTGDTADTKVAGKKKRKRAPPVLPTRANAPQND